MRAGVRFQFVLEQPSGSWLWRLPAIAGMLAAFAAAGSLAAGPVVRVSTWMLSRSSSLCS